MFTSGRKELTWRERIDDGYVCADRCIWGGRSHERGASLMKTMTLIDPRRLSGKITSGFLQAWDPVLSRSVMPLTAFPIIGC